MLSLSASAADVGAVQRAKALAELMVLDTPDEQSFDDLVFVAAKACGVPIALITRQVLPGQTWAPRQSLPAESAPVLEGAEPRRGPAHNGDRAAT